MIPQSKEKSEEMDREIARLSEKLAQEQSATRVVVKDLRTQLRFNRVVTRAFQRANDTLPPILLGEDK